MAKKKVELRFESTHDGSRVFAGARWIGDLVTTYQAGGRHCFRLRIGKQIHPRMYRGKQQAAEALLVIDDLVRDFKKNKWSLGMFVLQAWDHKIRSVERGE